MTNAIFTEEPSELLLVNVTGLAVDSVVIGWENATHYQTLFGHRDALHRITRPSVTQNGHLRSRRVTSVESVSYQAAVEP